MRFFTQLAICGKNELGKSPYEMSYPFQEITLLPLYPFVLSFPGQVIFTPSHWMLLVCPLYKCFYSN